MQSTAAIIEEPTDAADLATESPASIETIEVADPQGDEVLVEIVAASLCHTDVAITRGKLEEQYPLVMGHEGAGIVHSVGPDVESVEPGDHVVFGRVACGRCQYCRIGRSNLCEKRTASRKAGTLRTGDVRFSRNGTPVYHCHGVSSFSEYTVVTEEVAIGITDEVPLSEASLLGCGVFTGAGAVMNTADVEPGSTVAIFGAGGVGSSAIQAAALRGITDIIAVDVLEGKLERAASLGATHTINGADGDAAEQIREFTDGGVDYAFDTSGVPPVVEQAVDSLAPTGTAVIVGTPSPGKKELGIDILDLVVQEQSIVGSFNGSYNLETAIPKLAELVAAGEFDLSAMISDERPLSEVNEAMAALEDGDALRQVILPSDT